MAAHDTRPPPGAATDWTISQDTTAFEIITTPLSGYSWGALPMVYFHLSRRQLSSRPDIRPRRPEGLALVDFSR